MLKQKKVKTIRSKHPKKHLNLGFGKKRKIKHLIFSVLGIYLVGGFLIGAMLFNASNNATIDAGQSFAGVTASLRFIEEKEYKMGDKIKVLATLQNTSINESINKISLTLFSTKEMVNWEEVTNPNSTRNSTVEINKNFIKLPVLSAGERVQYQISGTLKDDSSDFLTILARLDYTNQLGDQSYETNRIFTELNPVISNNNKVYELKLEKSVFALGEEISLDLKVPEKKEGEKNLENGTIYIANKNTREVVQTQDCLLKNQNECGIKTKNLPVGEYTVLFISENKNNFSQIQNFSVSGAVSDKELIPNTQAEMIKPFQGSSINGNYPIIVERVISKNESLNSPNCIFQVLKGGELINEIESPINADRDCKVMITEENLNGAKEGGIYTVKLKNSNLSADFSFLPESATLEIKSKTNSPEKGQAITLEVNNVNDKNNNPIAQENLNLFIYHKNSGKLENLKSLEGIALEVKNGKFETTVPAKYFQEGGEYLIWVRLESGRLTKFLPLIFSNSELGLSTSGVKTQDYSNLKVDKDINFSLEGVTDKDGNLVENGDCSADVYASSIGLNPIKLSGEIQSGKCKITLNQGRVTKAGPILVDFNTGNVNSLPQSRVFQLKAGKPMIFGELNFEFSPVRKNYVNQIIIGPVVDSFGNLTDSLNKKLVFTNLEDNTTKTIDKVNIINGYAEVTVPSSLLDANQLKIELKNNDQDENSSLLSKEITTQSENLEAKLILPSIPSTIKSNEGLTAGISGIENQDIDKCEIEFIKNLDQFLAETVFYSFEKKGCQINWNINKFRDVSRALVKFKIGDLNFAKIVNLESGEPANNFIVSPQVRFNQKEELEINLLTSPILDKYGKIVEKGKVTWQYNGKVDQTEINNGSAKLEILSNKLESRDIVNKLDKRFLDLDIDVKADVVSISKNSNINIFLSRFDIANTRQNFEIQQGSNYLSKNETAILSFKADSCQAFLVNNTDQNQLMKTHWQGGNCYVEIKGDSIGQNQIVFSNNGFDIGRFDIKIGDTKQPVKWCKDNTQKCEQIQIVTPISSPVTAVIFDGENQWKFTTKDLENTLQISQNGLNPIKEYLVKVSYKNIEGQTVEHYKQILGERLIPSN
jgi:hypothetical protein